MDEKKYVEFSKNLLDHYIKINDFKSAFNLLIKIISNLKKDDENIKNLTLQYKEIN